jgi:hypothetical protein
MMIVRASTSVKRVLRIISISVHESKEEFTEVAEDSIEVSKILFSS